MVIRVILFFAVIISINVFSAPVEGLYTENVSVANQQEEARNEAATQGMAPVLVRISGSSMVLLNGDIQRAMKNASRYLNKFSYKMNTAEPGQGEPEEEILPYTLNLAYRKPAILNLLRSSNEPIWSENRPATLIWLVVDNKDGRRLPLIDDEIQIRQILAENSVRRGLPILWPVYDLEEQAALSVESLWSADSGAIKKSSARYDVSGILLGRLLGTSDGKWRVAWEYSFNDSSIYLDNECEDLDDCVAEPIDAVAQLLSARYSLISTDLGNQVQVEVRGVNSFEQYGTLLFYFKDLIAVSDVALNRITGSNFEFTLGLTTDRDKLVELISLNKMLESLGRQEAAVSAGDNVIKDEAAGGVTVKPSKLVYQWR